MVYKKGERKNPTYQKKVIDQNGETQGIQNQVKSNEVQLSLEWLEATIALEQAWMGRL